LIAEGEIEPIKAWLQENVHQYGKRLTPNELIQQVTGQAISVQPLVRYLTKKYQTVAK